MYFCIGIGLTSIIRAFKHHISDDYVYQLRRNFDSSRNCKFLKMLVPQGPLSCEKDLVELTFLFVEKSIIYFYMP